MVTVLHGSPPAAPSHGTELWVYRGCAKGNAIEGAAFSRAPSCELRALKFISREGGGHELVVARENPIYCPTSR